MRKTIIKMQNVVPRILDFKFNKPINWTLETGQHWVIIGPNGAGKTLFANMLTGKIPLKEGEISYHIDDGRPLYEQIRSVMFHDIYSLADYKNMYYQQRWNSTDVENSPIVGDLIADQVDKQTMAALFSLFQITGILDKRLILLSSGELRKFLIVRILLTNPKVLVLDNPYIGLDTSSRESLNKFLIQISLHKSLNIILILSNPSDIPEIITHILPICERHCEPALNREEFFQNTDGQSKLFPVPNGSIQLPLQECEPANYRDVLDLRHICIKYGKHTILDDLNWSVKKEEKWVLLGPNGAGKSTILSLICADNPQSYANTFYLFGRKRGSGESIWDIKKHIGYVSPETHLYYYRKYTCIRIVSSGFFDTMSLTRKCSEEQLRTAHQWMAVFGIEHLCNKSFLQLSFGEQRLVILARAFVKNPNLLILDEPLHGLDISNKTKVLKIIEEFCKRKNKTMIYVTHYLNEIPNCVTQQYVLKRKML